MKKEIIYARISSQDQKKGDSIEAQTSALKEWSKQENIGVITKVYVDEAKSAYLDDEDFFTDAIDSGFLIKSKGWNGRENLKQLLFDAKQKKFDIVRIFKLDRFGRNILMQEGMFIYLKSLGIEVKSLSEGDYIKDRFVRGIFGLMNAKSSEDTAIRTELVRQHRFEKGMLPNKAFYGYTAIKKEDKIVDYEINQEEAKVIRTIFEHKIEGIAPEITINKLRIPKSRYYDVLKRKEYAGFIIHRNQEVEAPKLRIIDLEIWKKAQLTYPS